MMASGESIEWSCQPSPTSIVALYRVIRRDLESLKQDVNLYLFWQLNNPKREITAQKIILELEPLFALYDIFFKRRRRGMSYI